jgi:hypothetical protein
MRPILLATAALPLLFLGMDVANAHSGGTDANGCHYEAGTQNYHCHKQGKVNPDPTAPVKKSRENICHDATSPNYKTLKYYIPFPSMAACLKSGGVKSGNGGSH